MRRIKVAILRGGPSDEHDVSLKTGKSVIENLPGKYIPVDVYIDRKGVWHVDGVSVKQEKIISEVDVVFNAMHGAYGEDGKIQQILEHFKIPFTGSGALASAIGMNKILSKEIFKMNSIKSPVYSVFKASEDIKEFSKKLFKTFPIPVIIKPNNSGSSLGISIADNILSIENGIFEALKYSDTVIIEEFIKGKEATCGVIDNLRSADMYPLLPIEICKINNLGYFDSKSKSSGDYKEVCPGVFSQKEKKEIQEMAVKVHKVLGLKHYSCVDFVIHPKRGVYVIEVNTLPGLTKESLLPKSFKAIGYTFPQFLDHVITEARKKR